jgi:hypothetical protein
VAKKLTRSDPDPYYTNETRMFSFLTTNAASAIVYSYLLHYKSWSPSPCSMAYLNQ